MYVLFDFNGVIIEHACDLSDQIKILPYFMGVCAVVVLLLFFLII